MNKELNIPYTTEKLTKLYKYSKDLNDALKHKHQKNKEDFIAIPNQFKTDIEYLEKQIYAIKLHTGLLNND